MAPSGKRQPSGPGITHLRITLTPTAYIGPGRADLLERIAETRSIAAAGRSMGMSYKRAWSLVQALNEGFGAPLVATSRGGSAQGGAQLTPLGRATLDFYRSMQARADEAVAADLDALLALIPVKDQA